MAVTFPAQPQSVTAPIFELRAAGKSYGQVTALAPIDLKFRRGEVTALIGPSGAGKSTLLGLLVGLLKADGGAVYFDGAPLDKDNLRQARLRMGYVIQDGGLFPHLSARANVELMARELGWSLERREARIAELTTLVRLQPAQLARFPAELSGGQRQRVALMRALMLDPEVLLLDEPLSALDPMIRYELQDELKIIIAALGKTVILVTHAIAEAQYLAERIILMRRGAVVQDGSYADLQNRPADHFVRRFLAAERRSA